MTLKRSFRKIFYVTVKILYTYACIMQAESIIYPPRAIYLAGCRSVRLFNSKFGRRWICLIRLCLVLKDLKAIGIEKRGHRKKLLFAIEKLPLVDIAQEVPVGDLLILRHSLFDPLIPCPFECIIGKIKGLRRGFVFSFWVFFVFLITKCNNGRHNWGH